MSKKKERGAPLTPVEGEAARERLEQMMEEVRDARKDDPSAREVDAWIESMRPKSGDYDITLH